MFFHTLRKKSSSVKLLPILQSKLVKYLIYNMFHLFQSITGQCIGSPGIFPSPCRSPVVSAVLGPGGTLSICSDDLLISGPITVAGKLPFSSTVSLEGSLPAAGTGAVNYECREGVFKEIPKSLVGGCGLIQGLY